MLEISVDDFLTFGWILATFVGGGLDSYCIPPDRFVCPIGVMNSPGHIPYRILPVECTLQGVRL